jgi:hypothetical protein
MAVSMSLESFADEYILFSQSFRQVDGSMAACKGWWPTGISVCCLKIEMSNFLVQVQDNASNTWHWFIRVSVSPILFFLKSIYVKADKVGLSG